MDDIDTILNYKLADYFRIFSKVYKEMYPNNEELFNNDWADFIEYGTYRWEIIELQKVGFSRDSAREIFQKSITMDYILMRNIASASQVP